MTTVSPYNPGVMGRQNVKADREIWLQDGFDVLPGLLVLAKAWRGVATGPLLTHRHDAGRLEILLMASGCREYTVDGQRCRIVGGELLLVPPGATHSSDGLCQGKSCHYVVVLNLSETRGPFLCLSNPAAAGLREALRRLPGGRIPGSQVTRLHLEQALTAGVEAMKSRNRLDVARLGVSMAAFLLDVIRCAGDGRLADPSPWLKRLLAHMESRLDVPVRIDELARVMGASESLIKHRFKAETGMSPIDYLLRRKVELARSQLRDTDVPMTDLALKLGFSSSQHFSLVFRRYEGVSPSAWRHAMDAKRPACHASGRRALLARGGRC
jgi:AraC-like DNA-binding protein